MIWTTVTSRGLQPQPFSAKHALLLSASISLVGGNRGLWALRMPLEHLGSRVHPEMFSLAQAQNAFDGGDGHIKDESLYKRFDATITGFMELVEAAKHYPCAKRHWVEFQREDENRAEKAIIAGAASA